MHYAVLTDEFTGRFVQPVWQAFIRAATLAGVVSIPDDVIPGTEDDALFIGQQLPWIDPLKEANAWVKLVRAGFASEAEVIRKRGQNPDDVLNQIERFRRAAREKGLQFESDFSAE